MSTAAALSVGELIRMFVLTTPGYYDITQLCQDDDKSLLVVPFLESLQPPHRLTK